MSQICYATARVPISTVTSSSPSPPSSSSSSFFSAVSLLREVRYWPRSAVRFRWHPTVGDGFALKAQTYDPIDDDNRSPLDPKLHSNTLQPKSRREILLDYVKNVQPEFLDLFVKKASQQIVDAMRQTLTNMVGSLPPQFFTVTISAATESLAQLMYSVMMTGYMFKNAQYRMELQHCLNIASAPTPEDQKGEVARPRDYGTDKKGVSGDIIKWNDESGPIRISAVDYIESLEAEIEELKGQMGHKSSSLDNRFLEYLQSFDPENVKELSNAGEDVVLAMNTFVKRLLSISSFNQIKKSKMETNMIELGQLLYLLMVVGYSIRNIEVRLDLERVLGTSVKHLQLPFRDHL